MARKKKTVENSVEETENTGAELYSSEGFFEIDDDDTVEGQVNVFGDMSVSGEFDRNIKTFNLPSQDGELSYLLQREKEGEITITNRQFFPSMKEGYVLVCIEYDVN